MGISYEEEETLDSLGCEISEFLKGSALFFCLMFIYPKILITIVTII